MLSSPKATGSIPVRQETTLILLSTEIEIFHLEFIMRFKNINDYNHFFFFHDEELWLEPKYRSYGSDYLSGRVILGMARGNAELTKTTDSRLGPYGAATLEFGARSGPKNNVQDRKVTRIKTSGLWTEDFHIYTTTWSADGFRFQVDGEDIGELRPPPESWLNSGNTDRRNVDKMAPFDNEVYRCSIEANPTFLR